MSAEQAGSDSRMRQAWRREEEREEAEAEVEDESGGGSAIFATLVNRRA